MLLKFEMRYSNKGVLLLVLQTLYLRLLGSYKKWMIVQKRPWLLLPRLFQRFQLLQSIHCYQKFQLRQSNHSFLLPLWLQSILWLHLFQQRQ